MELLQLGIALAHGLELGASLESYYELDVDFITKARDEPRLLLRHRINDFYADRRLYHLLIVVGCVLQELSIESFRSTITSDIRKFLGVGHDVAI